MAISTRMGNGFKLSDQGPLLLFDQRVAPITGKMFMGLPQRERGRVVIKNHVLPRLRNRVTPCTQILLSPELPPMGFPMAPGAIRRRVGETPNARFFLF